MLLIYKELITQCLTLTLKRYCSLIAPFVAQRCQHHQRKDNMDKQARLSAIMSAISELKEKEDQALYGAELCIKAREYKHLEVCTTKLVAVYNQKKLLLSEAKDLQIEIDSEAKEMIL